MEKYNKINYGLNILFNDNIYINSNKLEKITLC